MNCLPNLPPELLSEIFSALSFPLRLQLSFASSRYSLHPADLDPSSPSNELVKNFNNFSRVCRGWRDEAMRELLMDLCVERDGDVRRLVKALEIGGRGVEVKHLRVVWNRQPAMIDKDPDLNLLPTLISLIPNVKYITLAGEQYNLSSETLIDSISDCKHLEGLDCGILNLPYHDVQVFGPLGRRSGANISSLLLASPRLVTASFDSFRSLHGAPLFLPPAYSPSLRSLTLKRVVLESDGLRRLFKPLVGKLKVLRLDKTSLGMVGVFSDLIEELGEGGLEELEVKDCDFWATWLPSPIPLSDLLLSLPSIHTLTILGHLDSLSPTFACRSSVRSLTLGSRVISSMAVTGALRSTVWNQLEHLKIETGGSRCPWTDEEITAVEEDAKVKRKIKWETLTEEEGRRSSWSGQFH